MTEAEFYLVFAIAPLVFLFLVVGLFTFIKYYGEEEEDG